MRTLRGLGVVLLAGAFGATLCASPLVSRPTAHFAKIRRGTQDDWGVNELFCLFQAKVRVACGRVMKTTEKEVLVRLYAQTTEIVTGQKLEAVPKNTFERVAKDKLRLSLRPSGTVRQYSLVGKEPDIYRLAPWTEPGFPSVHDLLKQNDIAHGSGP